MMPAINAQRIGRSLPPVNRPVIIELKQVDRISGEQVIKLKRDLSFTGSVLLQDSLRRRRIIRHFDPRFKSVVAAAHVPSRRVSQIDARGTAIETRAAGNLSRRRD